MISLHSKSLDSIWIFLSNSKKNIKRYEGCSFKKFFIKNGKSIEEMFLDKIAQETLFNDSLYLFISEGAKFYQNKNILYWLLINKANQDSNHKLLNLLCYTSCISNSKELSDDVFYDIMERFKPVMNNYYTWGTFFRDPRFPKERVEELLEYFSEKKYLTYIDSMVLLQNPNEISSIYLEKLIEHYRKYNYNISDRDIFDCSYANFDIIYNIIKHNQTRKKDQTIDKRYKKVFEKILTHFKKMTPLQIHLICESHPEIYEITGVKKQDLAICIDQLTTSSG